MDAAERQEAEITTTSGALRQRARASLAGGVSSEFRRFGYPDAMVYDHASGTRITDADGVTYLDFALSQGPMVLGHSHPEVLDAVTAASARGQLYAGQFEEEIELAETIQRLVPCAERIRFGLDGSTMVQAALRLARAVTGRPKYLRFEGHYHGWLDNVAVGIGAPSREALGSRENPHHIAWSAGLPGHVLDDVVIRPWNDLDLVEQAIAAHPGEIGAIITEPVMCNSGCILPRPGYLEGLRRIADNQGAVLIFDEVITGFRLGLGGAQAHFGVVPDLAIFAKAVANGYPLSVLAGSEKVMQPITDGKVVHAGTLNAGVPSVAAARATIGIMENERAHEGIWVMGKQLMAGLQQVGLDSGLPFRVQGPGPMFHTGFTQIDEAIEYRDLFDYDTALGVAFVRGLHRRGVRVLSRGLWYLSSAHTEADLQVAIEAAQATLAELAAERTPA
jgi:glutamate-1-semialdehyde 2,1-aminomutase